MRSLVGIVWIYTTHSVVHFFIFLGILSMNILFSCNPRPEKVARTGEEQSSRFYLRSTLKAILVGNEFSYCDTAFIGETSCFIMYNGNRYLKKEMLIYDSLGGLEMAIVFGTEGAVRYDRKQLLKDSLLMKLKGWDYKGNELKIRRDSILSPITGRITELDTLTSRLFYLSQQTAISTEQLIVFEFWK